MFGSCQGVVLNYNNNPLLNGIHYNLSYFDWDVDVYGVVFLYSVLEFVGNLDNFECPCDVLVELYNKRLNEMVEFVNSKYPK
jgi:hypothetical protein